MTRPRIVSVADVASVDARGHITLKGDGAAGYDPATQRARQASGEDAEDLVARLHEVCAVHGVARVRKRPTPFRVLGAGPRKGTLLVVPAEKAGVDYHGHLRGGRAVYIEAKRVEGERLPLARLEPNQVKELREATADGALGVVLVLAGRAPKVCPVPWSAVAAHLASGAASLGPAELEPWRVDPARPYLAGLVGW